MEKQLIEMHWVKETKNTHRYEAPETPSRKPPVDCIYIQKSAVGAVPPKKLLVTVELAGGE